jgi:hypothetical protein
VVRYLLNKPGAIRPGVELTYGSNDTFIAFDPAHLLPKTEGADLFMPLVDHNRYHLPCEHTERCGVLAFAHRKNVDDLASLLPEWLGSITKVTMAAPRTPDELADLYRRASWMAINERSVAIFEAISCGCPVLCIPSKGFEEITYQRRFKGAGMSWSLSPDALCKAKATLPRFIKIHTKLERSLDHRIGSVFDPILKKALRRTAAAYGRKG